ncbi:hypothetical protein GCM10023224_15740 [Streptomonospora halophila]|uniref:Uncharacterized protein n=1 Tax=Streptomonospora halophila TaxID=427369 RepID=A0ABP9GBR1_9ACTN
MSIVRYVGFFHDRDHIVFGDVASEGEVFFSLQDAKSKLRARAARNGTRCHYTYPISCDGMVATHNYECDAEVFFSVTEDAYIDLYPVLPDPGRKGWAYVGDPAYRLSFGPRFGVHTETF